VRYLQSIQHAHIPVAENISGGTVIAIIQLDSIVMTWTNFKTFQTYSTT
jgi:hypothetical protein